MKRFLALAIFLTFAMQAFSQFDWAFITSGSGVDFYWRCRKELKDQFISELKVVNNNSYPVKIVLTSTFTVGGVDYKESRVVDYLKPNVTKAGQWSGYFYYPGGGKTCPSYAKLDFTVTNDSKQEEPKTPAPSSAPGKESASTPTANSATFDWKFITSGGGIDYYCRCRKELSDQYISELKLVNKTSDKVTVRFTPSFTVNSTEYKMSSVLDYIQANATKSGEWGGYFYYPGGGKTCPSRISIEYKTESEPKMENSSKSSSSGNYNQTRSSTSSNTSNSNYNETQSQAQERAVNAQKAIDDENARRRQQTAQENERRRQQAVDENERQKQQSKENYEAQLKQSKQINSLSENFGQSLGEAIWGTPEQRQAALEAKRSRVAAEEREKQELEESRRIEREEREQEAAEERRVAREIREREAAEAQRIAEERRRIEEEKQRIEEEKRRIEAEQALKRDNYYEGAIPAYSAPNKYRDGGIAEVFFFYVIRKDNNTVSFSNLFPVRKLGDNSWPFKPDIDSKMTAATHADKYKLVGYFPDKGTAATKQQELIQDAQQEGFDIENFSYQFKVYDNAPPGTSAPRKTEPTKSSGSSDFWNK